MSDIQPGDLVALKFDQTWRAIVNEVRELEDLDDDGVVVETLTVARYTFIQPAHVAGSTSHGRLGGLIKIDEEEV